MSTLHKYVPKEMLPEEFGGDAGPMEIYHSTYYNKTHFEVSLFPLYKVKISNYVWYENRVIVWV